LKAEQLLNHDKGVIEDAKGGGAAKKTGWKEKLEELKKKDREEGEMPVIDPFTVKVRKFTNEMTEHDLDEIM